MAAALVVRRARPDLVIAVFGQLDRGAPALPSEAVRRRRELGGLPRAAEVDRDLNARDLAVADPRLCDWDRRDLGDYAQLGLWLLDGMEASNAREAVKAPWGKAAEVVFDKLLRALPEALKARDHDGIIVKLEELGLCPLVAQNVEHMLCEFRKLCMPEGRPSSSQRYAQYEELWREVAPILERRARSETSPRNNI